MTDQVITTGPELKETIDSYRRKIAVERDLYLYYEKFLPAWHPSEWESVKRYLIARAHYWRGEMLRAKHNLARYIRGEELKLQPCFVVMNIEDQDVNQVLEEIEASVNETLNSKANPVMIRLAESYLSTCISSIKHETEYIERHTYGG